MRFLVIGKGEHYWILIQRLLQLDTRIEVFVVTCDAEPPENLERASNLHLVKLDFDQKLDSWDLIISKDSSRFDCLISFQFPFKVPDFVLSYFNGLAWNLHTAPLPEFGGWNGSSHAIIEEFCHFGPTLHVMNDVIDGGQIVSTSYFELEGNETSFEISEESKRRGIFLVLELVRKLINNLDIELEPKGSIDLRFYQKRDLEQFRYVSLQDGSKRISKIARAFSHPNHSGAVLDLGNGVKLEIRIISS